MGNFFLSIFLGFLLISHQLARGEKKNQEAGQRERSRRLWWFDGTNLVPRCGRPPEDTRTYEGRLPV